VCTTHTREVFSIGWYPAPVKKKLYLETLKVPLHEARKRGRQNYTVISEWFLRHPLYRHTDKNMRQIKQRQIILDEIFCYFNKFNKGIDTRIFQYQVLLH